MATLLIVAWLVPVVLVANRTAGAVRSRWSRRERRAALPLPSQRRGE